VSIQNVLKNDGTAGCLYVPLDQNEINLRGVLLLLAIFLAQRKYFTTRKMSETIAKVVYFIIEEL